MPNRGGNTKNFMIGMLKNLVNRTVLLPSGEVTEQHRGNPSGQFSTTMDNNMINTWLQAFEFAYFHGPNKQLWLNYDTLVYGDDRLSTTPLIPDNYVERVVLMYKDVFFRLNPHSKDIFVH